MQNAPTINELADAATRAEHLMRAAKMLHDEISDTINRPRQKDLQALDAVLHVIGELVGFVAIELRTGSDQAETSAAPGLRSVVI